MTDGYFPLPVQFRQAAPLLFNVDFFDFISGAGYKRFYLAGLEDSVGQKFLLTNDTGLSADENNARLLGTTDTDYDITFDNPVTIAAADASISYTVFASGAGGQSMTIVWTVYHVTSGGTETSLGTVTDTGSDGVGGNAWYRRSVKLALTSKRINKGEKLRVNVAATQTAATFGYYIDPSGLTVTGGTGGSASPTADINVPFVLDL